MSDDWAVLDQWERDALAQYESLTQKVAMQPWQLRQRWQEIASKLMRLQNWDATVSISPRTGKDYRDDGSFWAPLRDALRFKLPTEILELVHRHYVVAEFEHALDHDGENPPSVRTDQRLLLDTRRLLNAEEESRHLTCLCGIPGGCCYYPKRHPFGDDNYDGSYHMECKMGEIWLVTTEIEDALRSHRP